MYNYIKESDMPKLLKSAGNIEPFEKVYVYADSTRDCGYVATPNSFKINRALYADEPERLSDWDKATIYHLDKVLERNKAPFDLKVDRYLDADMLDVIIDQNPNISDYGTLDRLVDLMTKEPVFFKNEGYTSTSTSSNKNFFKDRPIKLEIGIPKGTKMFVTENYEESELVLPRGTVLEVISAERKKNRFLLKTKVKEE